MAEPMRVFLPLLAVALFVAGCGGEEKPSSDGGASAAIAEAAEQTSKVKTTRVAVESTIESDAAPGEIALEGTGVIDNRAQRGRLELEAVEAPQAPGLDPGDLGGEVVFDRFVLYMKLGTFEQLLPAGKEWVRLDLQKLGKTQGIDLSLLSQAGAGGDPTQSVKQLSAVSDDVQDVGEEEVRGVPTTHYEATVDLTRYPEQVPPEQREETERSVEQLVELTGSESVPTEVWIDEEGNVRRLLQTTSFEVPGGAEMTQTQQLELYDFGVKADVTLPPDKRVIDAAELLQQDRGIQPQRRLQ